MFRYYSMDERDLPAPFLRKTDEKIYEKMRKNDVDNCNEVVYTWIRLNAQIAQSVEQRTENPRVTGSIPVLGIILL